MQCNAKMLAFLFGFAILFTADFPLCRIVTRRFDSCVQRKIRFIIYPHIVNRGKNNYIPCRICCAEISVLGKRKQEKSRNSQENRGERKID